MGIISSSKHPDQYILPKDGWETDETREECCIRECEEEAGIKIQILEFLKEEMIIKQKTQNINAKSNEYVSKCKINYFLCQCEKEYITWPEMEQRKRKWVHYRDSIQYLRKEFHEIIFSTFDFNS